MSSREIDRLVSLGFKFLKGGNRKVSIVQVPNHVRKPADKAVVRKMFRELAKALA